MILAATLVAVLTTGPVEQGGSQRWRRFTNARASAQDLASFCDHLRRDDPASADADDVALLLRTARSWARRSAALEADLQDALASNGGQRFELDAVRDAETQIRLHLSKLEDPALASTVVEWCFEESGAPWSLRSALLEALSARAEPFPFRSWQRLLRAAEDGERALAFQSLLARPALWDADGEAGRTSITDACLAALSAKDSGLRRLVVRAIAKHPEPRFLLPLVELLEDGTPRTARLVSQVLSAWTGQSLGLGADPWRRAIEAGLGANGLQGLASEVEEGAVERAVRDGNFPADTYYGIPREGRHVVFVLDVSDSMDVAWGKPRTTDGTPPTRLSRAKDELVRCLRQLPEGSTFAVVAFDQRVHVFSERMEPVRGRTVDRACEWVEALETSLWTHTYGALLRSFAYARPDTEDAFHAEGGVDTIYLLTDGLPTLPGKPPASEGISDSTKDLPETIVRAVTRWNPLGRITVHTIGIKGTGGGPFLKDLARRNGGACVLLEKDGP